MVRGLAWQWLGSAGLEAVPSCSPKEQLWKSGSFKNVGKHQGERPAGPGGGTPAGPSCAGRGPAWMAGGATLGRPSATGMRRPWFRFARPHERESSQVMGIWPLTLLGQGGWFHGVFLPFEKATSVQGIPGKVKFLAAGKMPTSAVGGAPSSVGGSTRAGRHRVCSGPMVSIRSREEAGGPPRGRGRLAILLQAPPLGERYPAFGPIKPVGRGSVPESRGGGIHGRWWPTGRPGSWRATQ